MAEPSKYKRLIVGVVVLGALVAVARTVAIPDCATIQAQVASWGALAPLVFLGAYVVATIAFIPGILVSLVAGLALGAWWGTIVILICSTFAATLAFLLARYVARDLVEGLLINQPWFDKFKAGIETNGLQYVIFARLVPLFPFNGLNFACGLVPLRLTDYVLGSLLGMLPGTFAWVYLGETGCQLIDPVIRGEFRLQDLPADARGNLLIAVGLLALLATLPIVLRRLRRPRTP